MKKAFLHITEAVLAIVIIYVVLNSANISLPAKYSDPANTARLHRIAGDAAAALCGNDGARALFIGDSLPAVDLTLPDDTDWRVSLYDGSTEVASAGSELTGNVTATESCIVSGWVNPDNSSDFTYAPKRVVVGVWSK